MEKLHINPYYIIDIKLFKQEEHCRYIYNESTTKKIFFGLFNKQIPVYYNCQDYYGVFGNFDENKIIKYLEENYNDNKYIKVKELNDWVVYIKPHIQIDCIDNYTHFKYFNTYIAAEIEYDSLKRDNMFKIK